MTTGTFDFLTWFSVGCYGGLVCCMGTLAVCILYTIQQKRGTTRQLIVAITCCFVSAVLLLPAFFWYNLRSGRGQPPLPASEIAVALIYVAICGWIFPLGVMLVYCFLTTPRTAHSATRPSATLPPPVAVPQLYQRQPGVPVPFVFDEETPWGWLEHLGGRLKGQRLALKRVVISLGRDEENDIWLDDDMASRHHADLTWNRGAVFVTDYQSMNGVMVNGQRIAGFGQLKQGEILEIGIHRFLFEYAKPPQQASNDDPLLRHARNVGNSRLLSERETGMDETPWSDSSVLEKHTTNLFADVEQESSRPWKETAEVAKTVADSDQAQAASGPVQCAFVIRDGELSGKMFPLDRAMLTIGRSFESDVVINDDSISRLHAQVLRQQDGDYVQDLGSRNGIKLNERRLTGPGRLHFGDQVLLGSIRLEYMSLAEAQAAQLPAISLPPMMRPNSGVVSLHLPSRRL